MVFRPLWHLSVVLLLLVSYSKAQVPPENLADFKSDSLLKDVVITTFTGEVVPFEFIGGLTTVNRDLIEQSDLSNPLDILNTASGVYMQSGALNTNRITIRGIGARTPFSTNKIRAYYGQIPLTDGVGETTIEDLDLVGWGSLSILKGPISSIYGAGLGGVMLIDPLKIEQGLTTLSVGSTLGSFNLFKHNLSLSAGYDRFQWKIGYYRQTSDGYRDNNSFERSNLDLTASYNFTKTKIDLIGYLVDQRAEIPSSINLQDYQNSPRKAAFAWGQSQGYEDYLKLFGGVTVSHAINTNNDLKTTIYINNRTTYEARPFNILEENVTGIGMRQTYFHTLKDQSSINSGFELYQDQYAWNIFENLYETGTSEGSIQGQLLSENDENRSYINVFSEYKKSILKQVDLSLGLSANKTWYSLEKIRPLSTKSDYEYNVQFSPKLGLSYTSKSRYILYGLISRGFSPPSLEETLTPDGDLNPEIQPETGWNYEFGLRTNPSRRIVLEANVYLMSIKNLLVARRTALDQYVGINAGTTEHLGLESTLLVDIVKSSNFNVVWKTDLAVNRFRFKTFIDDDNDFSGNALTGVPPYTVNSIIKLQAYYFDVQFAYQFVSQFPIDDANIVYNDAYHLFTMTSSLNFCFSGLSGKIKYRANNIFNQKYASMVAVNASGFGGNAPRYYYPGLPLNHQVALSLDLKWKYSANKQP